MNNVINMEQIKQLAVYFAFKKDFDDFKGDDLYNFDKDAGALINLNKYLAIRALKNLVFTKQEDVEKLNFQLQCGKDFKHTHQKGKYCLVFNNKALYNALTTEEKAQITEVLQEYLYNHSQTDQYTYELNLSSLIDGDTVNTGIQNKYKAIYDTLNKDFLSKLTNLHKIYHDVYGEFLAMKKDTCINVYEDEHLNKMKKDICGYHYENQMFDAFKHNDFNSLNKWFSSLQKFHADVKVANTKQLEYYKKLLQGLQNQCSTLSALKNDELHQLNCYTNSFNMFRKELETLGKTQIKNYETIFSNLQIGLKPYEEKSSDNSKNLVSK